MDGTTDISGNEQEFVCVRFIDKDLGVREDFTGLYSMKETAGRAIVNMLKDVLIRTQLPLANLRAQTYDGASNMSGEFNGCQAEIKKQQPLALYTHCGAHVTHLITSKAVSAAPFIRDALDAVQELGNLYSQSDKLKSTYLDTNATKPEIQSPTNLKPNLPYPLVN